MKALVLFVLSMCGVAWTQTASTWDEQMACASTARLEGNFARAEECLRAALETANSMGDRARYADTLNNLGGAMVLSGRPRDAEPLYMQSLSIYEAVTGAASQDTAALLHNIAVMYRVLADYNAAEVYCRRALAIREAATSGASESEIATFLNTLGSIHFASGRYAEAEQILLRSLSVKREKSRDGELGVATTLVNLGLTQTKQGRYSDANRTFR
jgi:tetratricopeptide (TPR) repeat protein